MVTLKSKSQKADRPTVRGASREISSLKAGCDFREPKYRRAVFLRFYEFHLLYRSHPGCVYYVMPWLTEEYKLDAEQKLWLAFLNGNTQNIVTSWEIFKRFEHVPGPKQLNKLRTWFNEAYSSLAWDTDRRYHRKDFLASVSCYAGLVGDNQKKFFSNSRVQGNERASFDALWEVIRKQFYTFGRLSSFSYSEYLRLMGVPIECSTLFLEDMSGSKSHRNGIAKVLGRDDLDWYKETDFTGDYRKDELEWLEKEAATLLQEARERCKANPHIDPAHIHYFTLESALCTYKSWHRKNRRYPNVYNDMFFERIKKGEAAFGAEAVKLFWNCREECLPKYLRLECCPNDPGLVPEKQNHYRTTGQVIMMSKDFPEFDNPFDRKCWS